MVYLRFHLLGTSSSDSFLELSSGMESIPSSTGTNGNSQIRIIQGVFIFRESNQKEDGVLGIHNG